MKRLKRLLKHQVSGLSTTNKSHTFFSRVSKVSCSSAVSANQIRSENQQDTLNAQPSNSIAPIDFSYQLISHIKYHRKNAVLDSPDCPAEQKKIEFLKAMRKRHQKILKLQIQFKEIQQELLKEQRLLIRQLNAHLKQDNAKTSTSDLNNPALSWREGTRKSRIETHFYENSSVLSREIEQTTSSVRNEEVWSAALELNSK